MTEERLNSILSKFQVAGAALEKRAADEAERMRLAAEKEAKVKELWPNIRDTINSEVGKLNQQLEPLGFKLHTGIENVDDLWTGSLTIAFEPVGYQNGRLDKLRIMI
jgi:hypothetical protein